MIQKTKKIFKRSTYLNIYGLIVNIGYSIVFCISFTTIAFPESLWIGLFSFLGADTLYKTLEGKLLSYKDLVQKSVNEIPKENIIDSDVKS